MTQPMDIDPVSRAVQAELSKFAIRAPANDIPADRRISDRRDPSALNRFLSTIAENVHGLYWTLALEQWLLRQFDSDNEAAAMVAREELTTLDTLRRHLEAVDAETALYSSA
eukprot:jgi/Tetstr1/437708/TSEL_026363.t1